MIIGKTAQREMRVKWQADDRDAFAAQEERRSSWRRAQRGGVVACEVVAGGGELLGTGSAGDGHACLPRALALQFEQFMMSPLYRMMVVSWVSVLAVAIPVLRHSYSKLEHYL